MGYTLPAGPAYVPSDWPDHKYRDPPSPEPGTDYACAYGTVIVAAGTGAITDLKTSNSGGTGRYVTIALADGRVTRSLHLSAIWVTVGQYLQQGDPVGLSGASGNGSDWYYGPHLHETLLSNKGTALANSIDFENYVGAPPPIPTPEPEPVPIPVSSEVTMLLVKNLDTGKVFTVGQRFLHKVQNGDEGDVAAGAYNGGVTWNKNTRGWIEIRKGDFTNLLKANGIPDSIQTKLEGGKTWVDGVIS